MAITVELYGVARLRAGRPVVEVGAATLGEALAALEAACPDLRDAVLRDGDLLPAYIASVNGREFVRDPTTPLRNGDCVLVMSAGAGG